MGGCFPQRGLAERNFLAAGGGASEQVASFHEPGMPDFFKDFCGIFMVIC
jgi:hypothetical protein